LTSPLEPVFLTYTVSTTMPLCLLSWFLGMVHWKEVVEGKKGWGPHKKKRTWSHDTALRITWPGFLTGVRASEIKLNIDMMTYEVNHYTEINKEEWRFA
jgi:hypothetical protein